MPLDAIFLSALTAELNETLPGARIDKIQQPERDTILLQLRSQNAGNRRLLLSASSNHPRIHYTESRWENPAQPPMFCMLLRKHLAGGRILSLRQLPLERAVELRVESADELGELSEKRLILELMGRNSNLILTGPDGPGSLPPRGSWTSGPRPWKASMMPWPPWTIPCPWTAGSWIAGPGSPR